MKFRISPSNTDWLDSPIETLLLSYPRSGNSWTRYCLETLSGRPTHGDTAQRDSDLIKTLMNFDPHYVRRHLICPLGMLISIPIDITRPVVAHKRHGLHLEDYGAGYRLVTIVRDYKEAILRNRCYSSHTKWTLCDDWRKRFVGAIPEYTRTISAHRDWKGPRHLMYYEDLLTQPAETLNALLTFLDLPTGGVPEFVANLDTHRKRSIELYTTAMPHGSRTLGIGIHAHSKVVTEEDRTWMNQAIRKRVWFECLDRYATT